jgi:hypothetical protein
MKVTKVYSPPSPPPKLEEVTIKMTPLEYANLRSWMEYLMTSPPTTLRGCDNSIVFHRGSWHGEYVAAPFLKALEEAE